MKIFISYNSRDVQVNKFVEDLKTKLEKEADIDQVFIFGDSVDIPGGHVRNDIIVIMRKIVDCDVFLAVITQPYLDSEICHQEITYACNTHAKKVFSIIFEDHELNYEVGRYSRSIKMKIPQVNFVTFETTRMETSKYEDLLTGLRQYKSLIGNFVFVCAINITNTLIHSCTCVDKYQSFENSFVVGQNK